jgi:hypothetical protein
MIPVHVFEGSLTQARVQSCRANSRDKLAMSREDKSNVAWRLVVTTSLSKRQLMEVANVSEGLIASMRRAKDQLQHESVSVLVEMSWKEARLHAQGIEFTNEETDYEDYAQQEAVKLATRFRKVFGDRLGKNPDITARALELYDSSLPRQMTPTWELHSMDEDDYGEEPMTYADGTVDPVF